MLFMFLTPTGWILVFIFKIFRDKRAFLKWEAQKFRTYHSSTNTTYLAIALNADRLL